MERGERPWWRAGLWLALLGSFFFLSYNFANGYASRLPYVPSLAFAWERHVPFLAWTILPYWSSDLLYAVSFALCRTRHELDRHALRLLAIQLFSVACFILFPLRVAYERPPISGFAAWLFDSLTSFDQPFNEAPSLHVSLAVILWEHYRRHLPAAWRWWAGAWFVLMALSAWTTYQHQLIDLPTGAWAGLLTLAAIPERSWPESRRLRLMALYFAGAVAFTAFAFSLHAWILLWPGFALSLVAAAYSTGDPRWLCKQNGRVMFWMWPCTIGAWMNARLWTRGQEPWHLLAEGVWIGRAPWGPAPFRGIVDLTAELSVKSTANIPVLDLTVPRLDQLEAAVQAIDQAPRPALVCCALGYSRSATVASAWLIASGHATGAADAARLVRRARPQVVLRPPALARVQEWADIRRSAPSYEPQR